MSLDYRIWAYETLQSLPYIRFTPGLAILQKFGPVEKILTERGIWGNGEISKILFALRIHRVE